MTDFAQGGIIPLPAADALPIPVTCGYALAPAHIVKQYGAEFLALLNGSADTEIVSVND